MQDNLVIVGRIVGLFGVRGEVKVHAYTEPREMILSLSPWHVRQGERWQPMELEGGRIHGKGLVARLSGFSDREEVRPWLGKDIAVRRAQLPPPLPGEYYWADLEGLEVVNLDGVSLGRLASAIETPAHDVMVVRGERERLIPFVLKDIVRDVDLEAGVIRVDWGADF